MRISNRATAVLATSALLGAAALAVAVDDLTDVTVNVTAPAPATISISAPTSVSFGSVQIGGSATAPASVNIESSYPLGYAFSASRTIFSIDPSDPAVASDIPLSVQVATTPSGATAVATSPVQISTLAASPTSIGTRSGPTLSGGEGWGLTLGLGPIPIGTAEGLNTSTVTFTAVGL